ncbi:DpnI domain-containing protein [Streptococcus mutans]|uniref:DpnI domain-containing protein n=1 Tax=Streptococcus mutans TaxID=1309 RepID=UPI0028EA1ECB|nr:DpnI domain-containing protein [Streptococcus mutans]MDT9564119.1 restriction endonuclease [Streptococcus mutans]MDT9576549.1 restriction endonuclease [Streptococcus mutans]
MDLLMDTEIAENYRSNSQKIRVITENWVLHNSYCPNCGNDYLSEFENNRPVADFYCQTCREEFELKSKKAKFSNIINDGAYDTMINRLKAENNPNFFFLNYSSEMKVNNFIIIPKHFFTPNIIIKRKRLASTARRAGWIGCNIDISTVPNAGKIYLVKKGKILDKEQIQSDFKKTLFLRDKSKDNRGWTLDVLSCVDRLPTRDFSLKEMYDFENYLKNLHPDNHNIQAKIRHQLQILRDKGLIDFIGRGRYRKIPSQEV